VVTPAVRRGRVAAERNQDKLRWAGYIEAAKPRKPRGRRMRCCMGHAGAYGRPARGGAARRTFDRSPVSRSRETRRRGRARVGHQSTNRGRRVRPPEKPPRDDADEPSRHTTRRAEEPSRAVATSHGGEARPSGHVVLAQLVLQVLGRPAPRNVLVRGHDEFVARRGRVGIGVRRGLVRGVTGWTGSIDVGNVGIAGVGSPAGCDSRKYSVAKASRATDRPGTRRPRCGHDQRDLHRRADGSAGLGVAVVEFGAETVRGG